MNYGKTDLIFLHFNLNKKIIKVEYLLFYKDCVIVFYSIKIKNLNPNLENILQIGNMNEFCSFTLFIVYTQFCFYEESEISCDRSELIEGEYT